MKILILGAAGQISRRLIPMLLNETDHELILYARNADRRLKEFAGARVEIISADFFDTPTLNQTIQSADLVYLNEMRHIEVIKDMIETMETSDVERFIGASILGIYDEVAGEFGEWNHQMLDPIPAVHDHKTSARLIEESDLDYTLLRITWLYNEAGNEAYAYTQKGELFIGAQVTREAVARAIFDIIQTKDETYLNKSLGIYEPGSENLTKPSFYS